MKRALAVSLLLLAGSTLAPRPGIVADEPLRVASLPESTIPRGASVPGEVIVSFRPAAGERDVEDSLRLAGGTRARRSAFGSRYLVTLAEGLDVDEAIARLEARPEVEFAERNGIVRADFTPNDSLYCRQWHMRMLNAERTWDIQKGAPSLIVAVLDTGIAYEDFGRFRKAPDFGTTTFVRGFNVFTRDSHANDDNFHGTHVASTIAESTNNGVGVAGLAFNVALMPVKVLDADGNGTNFGVAEGIDYATNYSEGGQRVKVINMSLGSDSPSQTVSAAVGRAHAAGITVVASAGNDNVATPHYPSSIPTVISVGAVDARKQRARYSNFGPDVDVVAPGGDVRRDDDGACGGGPDGRGDGVLQQTFDPLVAASQRRYDEFAYFFVNGTSQAAPHVAAAAALVIQQGITDPASVKAALESLAEDLGTPGRDDQFGHGLIRPAAALTGLGLGR